MDRDAYVRGHALPSQKGSKRAEENSTTEPPMQKAAEGMATALTKKRTLWQQAV